MNVTFNMFIENDRSGIMKRSGMDVTLFGRLLEQPFMKVNKLLCVLIYSAFFVFSCIVDLTLIILTFLVLMNVISLAFFAVK